MRANNKLILDLKKTLSNYDINQSEFAVLEYLYHKGTKNIDEIRKHILLTSGSVTYVIDKLEQKEYVIRSVCSTDKRIFWVDITEKGKKLISEIFPIHKLNTKNIFKKLNQEEILLLNKLLQKI
ncbi:MarR family transcriptional regulator [Mycoplasma zalophi]|uniref:MarR family transcriptional regulator n=1 Tax=Mycoplasma zalophi TaxID=191287 RepID=A0ABS6DQL3_9MOLU|nr:MarR family transcriptional regulator [Mycoplasma zalophi]MBU4691290.1 MarR family transcriptional regulator [Mycoplasma zalophi]MBU4692504.1 MarR family transcriptional regulator [Mycoplasma zalophi]MCU4117338.1 MarR family transcriptional regulator [Mycoplasma zalophi]